MDASRVLQSVIEAEQRQKETSTVHEPKSEAGDDVEVVTRTVGSLTFRVEPAPKTATPGRSSSSRSSNHNNAQAHANQNTRTVSSEASLTSQAPIVSSLSRMPQPARKSATPTAGGGERRTQIDRDPEENMDELYVSTVALVQSGDVMNTLNFVKAHPCVCRFLVPFEMDVSPPRQQTLLQIFARAGLYHAVKFLLQLASENDHQGFVDLEARDAKFRTALHWAAINDLTFQPRGEGAATQRCYQVCASHLRVQNQNHEEFNLAVPLEIRSSYESLCGCWHPDICLQDGQRTLESRRACASPRFRWIHAVSLCRLEWSTQNSSVSACPSRSTKSEWKSCS